MFKQKRAYLDVFPSMGNYEGYLLPETLRKETFVAMSQLLNTLNLNGAHIHLLLNHVPILGAFFLTALFIVALLFRNTFLQKVCLWGLVFIALSTAVVYWTGGRAVPYLQGVPDVSQSALLAHEQAAKIALVMMFFTGIIALGGALYYSFRPKISRLMLTTVMIILLVNCVVFTYVGFLGGQITHPEIRAPQTAPAVIKKH